MDPVWTNRGITAHMQGLCVNLGSVLQFLTRIFKKSTARHEIWIQTLPLKSRDRSKSWWTRIDFWQEIRPLQQQRERKKKTGYERWKYRQLQRTSSLCCYWVCIGRKQRQIYMFVVNRFVNLQFSTRAGVKMSKCGMWHYQLRTADVQICLLTLLIVDKQPYKSMPTSANKSNQLIIPNRAQIMRNLTPGWKRISLCGHFLTFCQQRSETLFHLGWLFHLWIMLYILFHYMTTLFQMSLANGSSSIWKEKK